MKKLFLLIVVTLSIYCAYGQNAGTNIGDIAPEIKLKNPDGKEISLSSLRGQVVLIDFWASWCGPCRHENPTVVAAYNKYKNQDFTIGKGFTVYGVSIDKDKNSWIKGIADDKLTWTNVSDLGFWNSAPLKDYEVRGIPSNFLIDKNGIIVAKNLRGTNLDVTLAKYVVMDPVKEFEKKLTELEYEYNRLMSSEKYSNQKELVTIKKHMSNIQKLIDNLK